MHQKGDSENTQIATFPLDNAIVMSILSTAQSLNADSPTKTLLPADFERIKRLFGSILFVGGGFSKIPGAAQILQERLLNAYRHILTTLFEMDPATIPLERIMVLPAPREMDPQHLAWKGGAVTSRLESVLRDGWISRHEWQNYGIQSLRDKALFSWSQ
jgi:actin-related protein 8